MLIDCHVHLDDPQLSDFLNFLNMHPKSEAITVITNSADLDSSRKNLRLADAYSQVIPFIGIHPEIFSRPNFSSISEKEIDEKIHQVQDLLVKSLGIGEIGLDPKYGNESMQALLFARQLEITERSNKPVALHSKDRVSKILGMLSSYRLKGKVMFHWFAGTEQEMKILNDRGYYASFGPSILNSKRRARLVEVTDLHFLLAETDSPLRFGSVFKERSISPHMISSVLFSMSLIRKVSFSSMVEINENNALNFLGNRTSRVTSM